MIEVRHIIAAMVLVMPGIPPALSADGGGVGYQQSPSSLVVLSFSNPTAGAMAIRLPQSKVTDHGEAMALKVDISPQVRLPPELTLFKVASTSAARQIARTANTRAPESSVVVGIYSTIGPLTFARGIAGATAAAHALDLDHGHYCLIVLSNPIAGHEREYNYWYKHEHVPDVLRVPGFVSAQRFKLVRDVTPNQFTLPRYAVRFDLRTNDLRATIADVRHRLATGVTRPSAAFDMKSSITRYYSCHTSDLRR